MSTDSEQSSVSLPRFTPASSRAVEPVITMQARPMILPRSSTTIDGRPVAADAALAELPARETDTSERESELEAELESK